MWIDQIFQKFAAAVVTVLPTSPFKDVLATGIPSQGLAWLNWFIDIPGMLQILSAWLAAYALYLLYRIILRWIKAVS